MSYSLKCVSLIVNVDCETSVLTDKVIHQVSTGRGSGGGVAKRRKYICITIPKLPNIFTVGVSNSNDDFTFQGS